MEPIHAIGALVGAIIFAVVTWYGGSFQRGNIVKPLLLTIACITLYVLGIIGAGLMRAGTP